MSTWNELLQQFESTAEPDRIPWLVAQVDESLRKVGELRGGKHVLLYGSAWLQKQNAPLASVGITHEDVNGLMGAIKGMNWANGLTLVLHTPGGVTNATESIVDYLRAKFPSIEVIVPTFAMSAGTMISLASDRVVMARHSQLGPIDPQMPTGGGRSVSARAIVDQFEKAKQDVIGNVSAAHAWAPILASLGPALLREAENNLDYSEKMVAKWLAKYMFAGDGDAEEKGARVAAYFNDNGIHKSHGRRIGREEAAGQGVVIEELEASQDLQESVLTVYHLMTIFFEKTIITKLIWSDLGQNWMKNWVGPA